jgi:hypothetical protein
VGWLFFKRENSIENLGKSLRRKTRSPLVLTVSFSIYGRQETPRNVFARSVSDKKDELDALDQCFIRLKALRKSVEPLRVGEPATQLLP